MKMYYWKYFQLTNPDFFINIIWHANSMFGIDNNSYISYCIYYPKTNTSVHKKILSQKIRDDSLRFEYEKGKSSVIDFCDEEFLIQGEVLAESNPTDLLPILYSEDNTAVGWWKVLIPKGTFNGIVKTKNFEGSFQATVYQDEQYGSDLLQNVLQDWTWFCIHSNDTSHVAFSIKSKNTKEKHWYIRTDHKRCSISNENLFLEDFKNQLFRNTDVRSTFCPVIDSSLFSVDTTHVIRSRIGEKYGPFSFYYKRYVTIEQNNQVINGAFETMLFEEEVTK